MNVVDQKRKARIANNEEYKRLKREIQARIRSEKRQRLEEECNKINEYNEMKKSKELFKQIRQLKVTEFKPQQFGINNKEGRNLNDRTEILDR